MPPPPLSLNHLTKSVRHYLKQFKGWEKRIIEDTSSGDHLDLLMPSIEKTFSEFHSNVIEAYSFADELPHNITDELVQDKVDQVVSAYQAVLLKLSHQCVAPTSTPTSTPAPHLHTPPPVLKVPSFAGDPCQWDSFIAQFNSVIGDSLSLSKLQKLQHLLTSVSATPLAIIQHLPVADDSYDVAIKLLTERYSNPRLHLSNHCNALLTLPVFKSNSVDSMRNFIDTINVHIASLNVIPDLNVFETFTVYFLTSRIDSYAKQQLERAFKESNHLPSLPKFMELLTDIVLQKEKLATLPNTPESKFTRASSFNSGARRISQSTNRLTALYTTATSSKCPACSQSTSHKLLICKSFQKLSPRDRFKLVKAALRCINCLGVHSVSDCTSTQTCKYCHKMHHTMLHFGQDTSSTSSFRQPPHQLKAPAPNDSIVELHDSSPQALTTINSSHRTSCDMPSSSLPSCNFSSNQHGSEAILMSTCLVKLQTAPNNFLICRAVLDSGSHVSLISESCAQALKPHRTKSPPITISGVGQTHTHSSGLCHLSISPIVGPPVAVNYPFIIIPKITSQLPSVRIAPSVKEICRRYILADPTFDSPGVIDVLLGADITPSILRGSPHSLGDNLPYVIPTSFGHVLMGKAPAAPTICHLSLLNHSAETQLDPFTSLFLKVDFNSALASEPQVLCSSDNLTESLKLFWEIEEPPKPDSAHVFDQVCEPFFKASTRRDKHGRYIVHLPFKDDAPQLGDSYLTAIRRLRSLEKKFSSNPELKAAYLNFMKDYESQGHMAVAPPNSPRYYFIPYHGIYRKDNKKLRVVFDASCATSTGVSLNDILHAGPSLQTKITDVITMFRMFPYVFTCDICQMYRQIKVASQDHPYQCIVWREDSSLPPKVYYLTTVTYGVTSAPYLALRTIRQLAEDYLTQYPRAAQILLSSTFVDDIVAGAHSIGEAVAIREELICLLQLGGFALSKWASNHPLILDGIPSTHHLGSSSMLVKVLGLQWNVSTDCLSYVTLPERSLSASPNPVSKRQVLSQIAQIYDPCGWLSPTIMKAKCFLQQLWLHPLTWDSLLPPTLQCEWSNFISTVPRLSLCTVSRPFSSATIIQLHGFCDASKHGYAAVIFIKSLLVSPTVNLLVAKTKVAPIRTLTLPRLELLGAHLLSKLIHHYGRILSSHFQIDSVHLWCDSTIVLQWLKISPPQLKIFIANRVAQILEWTPNAVWHHVRSEHNAADVASRGVFPSSMPTLEDWWRGPKWLLQDPSSWPTTSSETSKTDLDMELRSSTTLYVQLPPTQDWFCHVSSWSSLIRIVSFILKLRYHSTCSWRQLYHKAFDAICFYIQQSHFLEPLKFLRQGKPLRKELQRLAPFIDDSGLIRIKGRFHTPVHTSFPILLPKANRLVHLLIDYTHRSLAHAGSSSVIAHLLKRVWILSARQVVRSRIYACITCFRVKPHPTQPIMGDLPLSRTTPTPPFHTTGMDYSGPYSIKLHHLRKSPLIKAYFCVFICFSTKAIHLELCLDLSTDAFINALNNFISRRGIPSELHSDCGTNFVSAAARLHKEWQSFFHKHQLLITQYAAERGIHFNFNPPAAPHQGGLWERAVQSTKFHMTRILEGHVPTVFQFSSLLIRVEGILNSRPLTPLSSDPANLDVLTPGHFLIGRPIHAIPLPDSSNDPTSLMHKYQWIQSQTHRFWKAWKSDYLPSLAPRSKWTKPGLNLQLNDLVLLEEPNSPPYVWPTGRIIEVFPDRKGVVRKAKVKTKAGVYLRPSVKLYRLPLPRIDDSSEASHQPHS